MPKTTHALHRHQFAGPRARVSHRIEHGDPGAEQRRSFLIADPFRHGGHGLRRNDNVLAVSPVVTQSGDLLVYAKNKIPPPARFTNKAMPTVPTLAHHLT